ncbi:MAG: hypothetical protein LPK85_01450, partial [Gammaproteobacteria bacterium]|nr:hypothetical protein [Gammaproteobacteria bacterium]
MTLASVDQVVQIQAVITGRLIDSITGSAPAPRTLLTLEYRRVGASAYRPCPLIQRMGTQGYFGFFATRGDLFAQRLPVPDFEFRLLAQTQGYQPLEHLFNLSGAHLTPENAELTLIGAPRTVRRLPGPPVGLILELAPQPLTLEGQVLRDGDPEQPVEGV